MTRAPFQRSVWIGHGQLHVVDLDLVTAFYCDVLGFTVTVYGLAVGVHAMFLAVPGRRNRTTLTTYRSRDGRQRVAVHYPSGEELAVALRRIVDHPKVIDDARDHGVRVAAYLRDPEGNGVELYYERPRGQLVLKNDRIDVREFLAGTRAA